MSVPLAGRLARSTLQLQSRDAAAAVRLIFNGRDTLSGVAVSLDVARAPLIRDRMALARWPQHAPISSTDGLAGAAPRDSVCQPTEQFLRPEDNGVSSERGNIGVHARERSLSWRRAKSFYFRLCRARFSSRYLYNYAAPLMSKYKLT